MARIGLTSRSLLNGEGGGGVRYHWLRRSGFAYRSLSNSLVVRNPDHFFNNKYRQGKFKSATAGQIDLLAAVSILGHDLRNQPPISGLDLPGDSRLNASDRNHSVATGEGSCLETPRIVDIRSSTSSSRMPSIKTPLLGNQQTLFRFIEILCAE
jgi:hypothetical protein